MGDMTLFVVQNTKDIARHSSRGPLRVASYQYLLAQTLEQQLIARRRIAILGGKLHVEAGVLECGIGHGGLCWFPRFLLISWLLL